MKFCDMQYERVDLEQVKSDFEGLMESLEKAGGPEELKEVHKKYYDVVRHIETMANITSIRRDGNTKDAFYGGEQEYYDRIQPEIENLKNQYKLKLYDSKYKAEIKQWIGEVAFKDIELSLKAFDARIIGLVQEENALITQYDNLIAGAKIVFKGEELNLSLLRKYLVSNDRATRREAHEKETEFFLSIEAELDAIYDKLVKNRTEQAKQMGYENYVELAYYRMGRNCYDKDMVESFRQQVKQYLVPLAEKMHEERRKRLGLERLSFVDQDVFFPEGNPEPNGSPEEILLAGEKMYRELSTETNEFFDFMRKNELFDVLGRKEKKSGGYLQTIPDYKSPFIFANFNGTSGDVDVMTHECGHGFQAYLVRNMEIMEHQEIKMETAEVHSMSMEFFTEPYMELFFGDRTEDYVKMHLEDSVIFIPYGCMVDEFQHRVYEKPQMTPKERKDVWLELESVYRPHMNYEDDKFFGRGGRWQKQSHIYDYPFYYIDYCLAMTCALQFKVKMDEDYSVAWDSYVAFCKASASGYFVDMIKDAKLDSPFQEGTIKEIVDKLQK